MMWLAIIGGLVLAALVLRLWAALRAQGRARAGALARAAAAEAEAEAATRVVRLGAQALRDLGLRLHGQADRAQAARAELAAAAAQLMDIADEFQDHALPSDAQRILREERLDLVQLTTEAVTAVSALVGPGRRHWRLPEGATCWLWADRRALRHVLSRVLADAVRNTRDDDWIEIALSRHDGEVALVIEDEGGGFATSGGGRDPPGGAALAADSRGIGLRLAVARGLMQAHGGRLAVEALPRVGTRVSLIFPAERVRAA